MAQNEMKAMRGMSVRVRLSDELGHALGQLLGKDIVLVVLAIDGVLHGTDLLVTGQWVKGYRRCVAHPCCEPNSPRPLGLGLKLSAPQESFAKTSVLERGLNVEAKNFRADDRLYRTGAAALYIDEPCEVAADLGQSNLYSG